MSKTILAYLICYIYILCYNIKTQNIYNNYKELILHECNYLAYQQTNNKLLYNYYNNYYNNSIIYILLKDNILYDDNNNFIYNKIRYECIDKKYIIDILQYIVLMLVIMYILL